MIDLKDRTRKLPAGELVPAPIQGNGPAWEGRSLSDMVVEDRATAGCQESAELSDKGATRLPSEVESSIDLLGSIEMLRDELDSRRSSGSLADITSTGGDQCCLNTFQNAGDEGGINALPGPPETRCMAEVSGSIATDQSAKEGTTSFCRGLERTDVHDVEHKVNPDHATPGQSVRQGSLNSFKELLQAAMRHSDAERAQDRESARNFGRVRQPFPEQQQGPVDQPIISTPAKEQPPTEASSSASNHSEVECAPADSVRVANDVAVESTDSGSPLSSMHPAQQPDERIPEVAKHQWVRYLSPEGYPYLYDQVTGESEWVVSGEEEAQSPQAEEPTRETQSGANHAKPGNTGHDLGDRFGNKERLGGTACIEEGERGTTAYPAESDSVPSCEMSQWSQDTAGPDAR